MTLLRLYIPSREMCASWDRTAWVSYRSPGPATLGALQVAIETSEGADAPVFTAHTVAFDPQRRGLTDVLKNGEMEDDGTERVNVTTTVRRFEAGVFAVVSESRTEEVNSPQ